MTRANKTIIDSSAWIEYFRATQQGEKARKILEESRQKIITPNIVAAEVTSKMKRVGENYEAAIQAIKSLSIPAEETQEDYINAGTRHAELRKKHPGISLADAIILTIAEKNRAKILTKDAHLAGKNTILLK
ncbi:MAG: PIN domain-containing protein [archaeon]|nr:PIN domain-containing protein [archaeon]